MPEATLQPNPLREGMRLRRTPEPCAMVIFGASGDLTQRKLLPALYYLTRERMLPAGFSVIGCGRTASTHQQFRESLRQVVKKYLKLPDGDDPFLDSFSRSVFYITDDFGEPAAYTQLRDCWRSSTASTAPRGIVCSTWLPPSFFP